jgi:phospholipase/carboxylesterase
MPMTRREFLAATAVAPLTASSGPTTGLRSQSTASSETSPGRHALNLSDEPDRDGFVYVPRNYNDSVPVPLLVMLHGAGNTALSTSYAFPLADEFGTILVAPDSRDERTWDGILLNWGPDVDFIARALGQTIARVNVDRTRLGVCGFSDGASYALSFGISFGDQFGHIIAMSPGVMQPIEARGKPKIFISHGTADQVMPIDVTSRRFVPRLKSLGYDVTYREYDGRHAPSPPIVHEAFEWFLK